MNILPTIEVPTYTTKIPSTGQTINYRPYLVKEEKILLIALESEDYNQVIDAINDIVITCLDNKFKLDDLTVFDIEYLFIKIRAKAVGETTKIGYRCETEGCEEITEVNVNFDDVVVSGLDDIKKQYDLGNGLIIDMALPKASGVHSLTDVEPDDIVITSVANLIETIYHNEEIYDATKIPLPEVIEFLGNLNTTQFNPLLDSVLTIPHIEYDVKWKCKCGTDNEINYSSLSDFFT